MMRARALVQAVGAVVVVLGGAAALGLAVRVFLAASGIG